uniref:Uncharacterized protein n=1 Tax=Moniliophthora roreri TaxID=221103 RepID=A0A0W0F8B8_MONRR
MFNRARGFNINGGSFNSVGRDQYNGNQFSDGVMSTNVDQVANPTYRVRRGPMRNYDQPPPRVPRRPDLEYSDDDYGYDDHDGHDDYHSYDDYEDQGARPAPPRASKHRVRRPPRGHNESAPRPQAQGANYVDDDYTYQHQLESRPRVIRPGYGLDDDYIPQRRPESHYAPPAQESRSRDGNYYSRPQAEPHAPRINRGAGDRYTSRSQPTRGSPPSTPDHSLEYDSEYDLTSRRRPHIIRSRIPPPSTMDHRSEYSSEDDSTSHDQRRSHMTRPRAPPLSLDSDGHDNYTSQRRRHPAFDNRLNDGSVSNPTGKGTSMQNKSVRDDSYSTTTTTMEMPKAKTIDNNDLRRLHEENRARRSGNNMNSDVAETDPHNEETNKSRESGRQGPWGNSDVLTYEASEKYNARRLPPRKRREDREVHGDDNNFDERFARLEAAWKSRFDQRPSEPSQNAEPDRDEAQPSSIPTRSLATDTDFLSTSSPINTPSFDAGRDPIPENDSDKAAPDIPNMDSLGFCTMHILPYHPISAIHDYILQTQKDVDVVVTHDNQWQGLFDDMDNEMLLDDATLLQRFKENFTVSTDNGSAVLNKK